MKKKTAIIGLSILASPTIYSDRIFTPLGFIILNNLASKFQQMAPTCLRHFEKKWRRLKVSEFNSNQSPINYTEQMVGAIIKSS